VTRRALIVAVLALTWASAGDVSVAQAHAVPLTTSPVNGSVLSTPPTVVEVTFDSPVRVGPRNAAIRNDGVDVLAGAVHVVGSRKLVLPLQPGLADGNYTARWSVVSDDGHEEEGLIAFGIGSSSGPPVAALSIRGFEAWQRVVMRTALFLGVLGAAGTAFFALGILRPLRLERSLLRRQAHALFVFFLLAFLGADALSHTAGAGGTRFERFMVLAAVAAGLGAAAAALTPPAPRLRYGAWGCAAVLFVCPTLAGHALDRDQPVVIAAIADLLHLGGAAVWIGGVAGLAWVSGSNRGEAARRFSSFALTAVALVAAGGVSRAVTELSSVHQLWSTGYGRTLLVKTGLFAGLLGLGLLARRRRPLVLAEIVVLTAVVAAVGTLTELRPGRVRTAPSTAVSAAVRPPAPPVDAYVDAREAGSLAVALAYRRGTVTVTLLGPEGSAAAGVPVTIAGRTPASCGPGCFSAPAGGGSIAVAVGADSLQFTLPARLRPAADVLRRATKVFEALRSVTFRERLASAPGHVQVTVYREEAPDRLALRIVSASQAGVAGTESIVIGASRWNRVPGGRWVRADQFPLVFPKPFWSAKARNAFFAGADELTFFDPTFPAWFRLRYDPATGRPLVLHMVGAAHFMQHRYSGFDHSPPISPPSR
jgi:copper transport protein